MPSKTQEDLGKTLLFSPIASVIASTSTISNKKKCSQFTRTVMVTCGHWISIYYLSVLFFTTFLSEYDTSHRPKWRGCMCSWCSCIWFYQQQVQSSPSLGSHTQATTAFLVVTFMFKHLSIVAMSSLALNHIVHSLILNLIIGW